MNNLINPSVFADTFPFPSSVADKYLKLASATQLKVLILIFKRSSENLTADSVAKELNLSVSDAEDAISYWASLGILIKEDVKLTENNKKTKTARIQNIKPTREEVARLAANDENLTFLTREAQSLFGRNLKQSEVSLLAWLYSDEGMDVSVILMLLQFAVREGKVNARYIESTAIEWIDSGVETLADAEKKMSEALLIDQCFKVVASAFGISGRKPTKKEKELSLMWVNEWKYDKKVLEKAYEICVDSTSNFSIPYIKTILDKWHKEGVKTVDDIKEEQKENKKKNDYAGYNPSVIEKLFGKED